MSGIVSALVGVSLILAGVAFQRGRRERLLGSLPAISPKGDRRRVLPDLRALRDDWRSWSIACGVLGAASGGAIGLLVGAGVGAGVALARAHKRAASLAALSDDQLADAVRSVSAGLRAGLSVQRSLSYAAEEAQEPLRSSLGDVVGDIEMGVPLDSALREWAGAGSADARLLAGVLRLHGRSGGDLPAVLDRVGTTLADRRAISREVRGLTAQARLSGTILGVLPAGFFAFLWLTSRSDIQGAIHNPVGEAAIGLGSLLDATAFLWIRHILRVR